MLITTNEKLKPIIEAMDKYLNDGVGTCGIFNIDDPDCKEVAEDAPYKETIYQSGNIKIVVCAYYDYFDVHGLMPLEFAELKGWYDWKKEDALASLKDKIERIKEVAE